MKDLSLKSPLSLAVAAGATTPAPPTGERPIIWSSIEGTLLGWNGVSWQEVVVEHPLVTWFVPNSTAAPTVDFTGVAFAHRTSLLAAGQLIVLDLLNGVEDRGIWVLGSVASTAAVPITRHPAYPAGKKFKKGTRIPLRMARQSILETGASLLNGANAFSSSSVNVTTNEIELQLWGGSIGPGALLTLDDPGGGAVLCAPLVYGTSYWVKTAVANLITGITVVTLATDETLTTEINLTTAGTDNADPAIAWPTVSLPLLDSGDENSTWRSFLTCDDGGIEIANPASSPWTAALYTASSFLVGDRARSHALAESVCLGSSVANVGAVAILGDAVGGQSIAIGGNTAANGPSSVGIGNSALALDGSAIAIGVSAIAGAAGVALGASASAAYPFSVALGPNSLARSYGGVSTYRLAGMWGDGIGGGGLYGEVSHELSVLRATSSSSAAVLLATSADVGAFTGVAIEDTTCSVSVRGILTAFLDDGTKGASWWIDVVVTADGTPAYSVADYSKLRSYFGAVSGWKVTPVATGTLGTARLDFSAVAEANVLWTFNFESYRHYSKDYAQVPFPASIPLDLGPCIQVPASEALTSGQLVSLWDSTGAKVRPASSSTARAADGFVLQAYSTSDVAKVYLLGENPFLSGLTVGPLYLSTAGGVTSTAPGAGNLVQRVGFALSATKMLFQRETPIQT